MAEPLEIVSLDDMDELPIEVRKQAVRAGYFSVKFVTIPQAAPSPYRLPENTFDFDEGIDDEPDDFAAQTQEPVIDTTMPTAATIDAIFTSTALTTIIDELPEAD